MKTKEDIFKEMENDEIRKWLIEKYGDECYKQAYKELDEEENKRKNKWLFWRSKFTTDSVLKRNKDIFEKRFGEVLK